MPEIQIESSLCTACDNCGIVCPWGIYVNHKNKPPTLVHQDLCVSCGHCLAVCPTGAISHSSYSNHSIQPISNSGIVSDQHLLELVRTRRSIRAFQKKSISKKLLTTIIDSARFAPSTNNSQSTHFTVVRDQQTIENIVSITQEFLQKTMQRLKNPFYRQLYRLMLKEQSTSVFDKMKDYQTIVEYGTKGHDVIVHEAPLLLFFHADDRIGFADVNAHLALQNASLMIHALGLGSFYAGYVVAAAQHSTALIHLLTLPKNHAIYGCLALGYPQFEYKYWIERNPPTIAWK